MPQDRLTAPQWLCAKAMALFGFARLTAWAAFVAPVKPRLANRLATADRLDCGLILILPGIEGESLLNLGIAQGLRDAGLPHAIEIFDWTRGRLLLLNNLMNLPRNRRQADRLAERIRLYQREYPNRPIYLIGHSGGTALATFALERLGPDQPVTGVIFLASALSPDYNLSTALKKTTRGIHHFHSRYDNAYLAFGTKIFGTIDRRHSRAAGNLGFRIPPRCAR